MKIWIVWLPNVGKSTLFNALTKTYSAPAENFPFCTIDPNVWMVSVKDPRIDKLAKISNTAKIVYAMIEFVDIAGLVKWASQWEWLGNKFLSHIREVDAIVQVLRHFKDTGVTHVEGTVDPLRDVEIINTELIMADLDQLERKLPSLSKKAKANGTKEEKIEAELLEKLVTALRQWKLAHSLIESLSPEELRIIKPYNLLTIKPFVYAINVGQDDLPFSYDIQQEYMLKLQSPVSIVCAKFESEMISLSPEEREEFLRELLESDKLAHVPTLDDLITLAFNKVGLMYYFTTGEKETRAWTIPLNSTAPQAAWAIHTDFERWFIKAEVVNCEHFIECWSRAKAKEKWLLKLEWKNYIVQDGDVIVFKFNV